MRSTITKTREEDFLVKEVMVLDNVQQEEAAGREDVVFKEGAQRK